MSYAYKRTFTVDHTQCGASDSSSFPVKIYGTITAFKTAANGGHIQNTVTFNGQSVPADICFYSDSGLTTPLSFEISFYDAATGKIVVWVKTNISHTADTPIYCAYDDSGVTTYQGGSVGAAWDSNFVRVYHLHSGASLNKVNSTSVSDALTTSGVTVGSDCPDGISGSFHFSPVNSSDAHTAAFTLGETTSLTIECWVYNNDNNQNAMFVEKSNVNNSWEMFDETNVSKLRGASSSTTTTATQPSQSAWHYRTGIISASTSGSLQSDAGTASTGSVTALGDTSTAMHLGNYDGFNYYANCSMVEVRISKSVRSADWITATYNSTKASSTFFSDSGESAIGGGTTYSNSVSLGATSGTSMSGSATMPSSISAPATSGFSSAGSATMPASVSAAATPGVSPTPGTLIPTSATLGATSASSTSAGTQIPVSISAGPTAALSAGVAAAIPGVSTLAASPGFIVSAILQAAASMSLDAVSGISETPAMDAQASASLDATGGFSASLPGSVFSSSISVDATSGISFSATLLAEASAAIGLTPAMVAQAAARLVAGAILSSGPAVTPSSTATMRSAIAIAAQSALSAGTISQVVDWLKATLGLSKPAISASAIANRPAMSASSISATAPMLSTSLSVFYGAVNG